MLRGRSIGSRLKLQQLIRYFMDGETILKTNRKIDRGELDVGVAIDQSRTEEAIVWRVVRAVRPVLPKAEIESILKVHRDPEVEKRNEFQDTLFDTMVELTPPPAAQSRGRGRNKAAG
jgi:hypothetical protein